MNDERVSPELRRATLSGARWTASSRVLAETVGVASSIILARHVPPAEFGYAAIALIVVALSAVIGTAGVSAPLVQRRDLTEELTAAVAVVALAAALLLTAATVAAAELVLWRVFGDKATDLVLLASPAWIFAAIGSPSQALLQRRLRFGTLAVIEFVSVVCSAALAVGLAFGGFDGEAVVAGGLGVVAFTGVLSFAAAATRSLRTDRAALRDAISFATPVGLSSLLYIGFRNVDYAILGARASAAQVGYYWRAYQLGVGYQSKISRVMLRVSFPVYSRAEGMDELRAVRTRIVRGHASVLLPLLALFVATAPLLIPWLFGPAWEPSVRPAQILAVAGMADAVVTGVGPLMIALGRPGALLRFNLLVLVVYAIVIYVLAPYGIEVVATGVAVFGVATVLGVQGLLLGPAAGLSFRQLWADTRGGLVIGAAVLLVATGIRVGLVSLGLADFPVLLMTGVASCLLYLVLLRRFFAAEWGDLRAILTRRRRDEGPLDTNEAVPRGDLST